MTLSGEEADEQLPLGKLLLHYGHITEEQLAAALEEQSRSSRPLGSIVVESGYTSPAAVAQALATQHGGLLKSEYGFATGFVETTEQSQSGEPWSAPQTPVSSPPTSALRIVGAPSPGVQPEVAVAAAALPPPVATPLIAVATPTIAPEHPTEPIEPAHTSAPLAWDEADARFGAAGSLSDARTGPAVPPAAPKTERFEVGVAPSVATDERAPQRSDATVVAELDPLPPHLAAAERELGAEIHPRNADELEQNAAADDATASREEPSDLGISLTEVASQPAPPPKQQAAAAEGRAAVEEQLTGIREELATESGAQDGNPSAAQEEHAAAQAEVARLLEDVSAASEELMSARDEHAPIHHVNEDSPQPHEQPPGALEEEFEGICEVPNAAPERPGPAESERASVYEALETLQKQLTSARHELAAVSSERNAARKDLTAAHEQLAGARQELAAAEAGLAAVERKRVALEARIAELDGGSGRLGPGTEARVTAAGVSARGEGGAAEQLAEVQRAVDNLFGQVAGLRRELDALLGAGDLSSETTVATDASAEDPIAEVTPPTAFAAASTEHHYVFVGDAGGYDLLEFAGPPPPLGATIELGGPSGPNVRHLVVRVGQAPLPGLRIACAYVLRTDGQRP